MLAECRRLISLILEFLNFWIFFPFLPLPPFFYFVWYFSLLLYLIFFSSQYKFLCDFHYFLFKLSLGTVFLAFSWLCDIMFYHVCWCALWRFCPWYNDFLKCVSSEVQRICQDVKIKDKVTLLGRVRVLGNLKRVFVHLCEKLF